MDSCKCKECKTNKKGGAIKKCDNYKEFSQMTLFEIRKNAEKKKLLRDITWEDYGLTDKWYRKKLKILCMSGEYDLIARSAAYITNPDIAEYILLSVKENKTYENVEFAERLGRIPCGRTDFYGYRRLFYYYFERALTSVQNMP